MNTPSWYNRQRPDASFVRRAGKFALAQNQWLLPLLSPLGNIRRLYSTVPFLSLVVFFAIYIGIINQRETWSRYVRFNAMQVSTMCRGVVSCS